jgi:hypothetical protein
MTTVKRGLTAGIDILLRNIAPPMGYGSDEVETG